MCTPLTEAHVGACRMQMRSSAKRSTLASGTMCEKRSGSSAYARSSGGMLSSAMCDERAHALPQRFACREHRRGLVAAVRHTVVAARIVPAAVLRPVRGLDQLLVRFRVPVAHQVA